MMEDLEKYITEKLRQMQDEKVERLKNVEPHLVTKKELFDAIDKDIRSVLNNLFHEKKIKVHKTIHAPIHDYVEFIEDKNDE